MVHDRHWLQRIADGMELETEPMPGVPVVELADDCRVLIERHRGVTEYGRERIGIRVRYGTLYIKGSCLELIRMTGQQLVITGCIDCIELQRRCR